MNGVNIPIGPLSFASPNYYNTYNAVVAIDWNISDKDQVRGRYFYNNTQGLDAIANLPVFFEPRPNVNKSISVSEFHNFSATMENELRVSYSRNNANITAGNFKFPGLDMFPNLAFDDLKSADRPGPQHALRLHREPVQLQDNLTKTWGRHTFKVGLQRDRCHPRRLSSFSAPAATTTTASLGEYPAGPAAQRRQPQRRLGRAQRRGRQRRSLRLPAARGVLQRRLPRAPESDPQPRYALRVRRRCRWVPGIRRQAPSPAFPA